MTFILFVIDRDVSSSMFTLQKHENGDYFELA